MAWLIFGLLFAAYLLSYTGYIQSSDGLAMFAGAESLARRGEADINQLLWMGEQQGSLGPDGDLYSRKGLGMTLLALPLVWAARWFPPLGLVLVALLLSAAVTAATGALLYRATMRLGFTRATAAATALLFGLATLAWPYSQEFFSDPVCGFGLFAAFYGLLAFAQTGRKRYLLGGGLGWALAYLARSINLITLPVYLAGLWVVLDLRMRTLAPGLSTGARLSRVFERQWRPMVAFLIPVAASGLISLWWNWLRFGNLFTTGYVESETFSANWLFGLAGLLVGPARGFFWYSPILLAALAGGVWFWRNARRTFSIVAALSLLYVGVYAKWYMWHGGFSWGPRFLVPLLPFVALLVAPVWQALIGERRHGRAGAAALWLLTLLSVGVQWLGMVIPFGLVQEWLAFTVRPLFAPETFIRVGYSPLWLQGRFISSETIHLHWWQGGSGWGVVDWPALLVPLALTAVGFGAVLRHISGASGRTLVAAAARPPEADEGSGPHPTLYVAAVLLAALALLLWQTPAWRSTGQAQIAARIAAGERRADDAILHLIPTATQEFANAYHGRLATWGLPGIWPAGDVQALLARLQERNVKRLWVVPDAGPAELSPWEFELRTNHYLLSEVRPTGAEGPRLALYALAGAQPQNETGLGTLFADPELAGAEITDQNSWIRLAGYWLPAEAQAGAELLLTLRWESLQPVADEYNVFVHLLDQRGERVAQRDGRPVQWLRPIPTWQPGESVIDRYGIPLPADLPPGIYTIAVGLYDPVSGRRLPVNAGPRDYAVELGPISILAP